MAGDERGPRAWHDVHSVQEAPREKQKSSGRIAADEAAQRKKIDMLRAQRMAREAATPVIVAEAKAKPKTTKRKVAATAAL